GRELLFYRAETGDIATGRLGTDGHFTGLAIGRLSNGWTHVVATNEATIRVMTYNMYVGTYFQALANVHTPSDVPNAIKQIYDEIVASEPAARAKAVARQITAESPDLVGLQEAYILRRSERPPEPGVPVTKVVSDQTNSLLENLSGAYEVVAVIPGREDLAPNADGFNIRLTYRIVMIARSGMESDLKL